MVLHKKRQKAEDIPPNPSLILTTQIISRFLYKYQCKLNIYCIKKVRPYQRVSCYDSKPSDGVDSVLRALGNADNPFIAITPQSTLTRSEVHIRVPFRGQILLFNHLLYRKPLNCWFGLVSLFNGISTLFRLFNAKAILLEEQ